MWKVKHCFTDQTATVGKYLREDFEPFAVVPVAQRNNVTGEVTPRFRMYFKYQEYEIIKAEATEEKDDPVREAILTIMNEVLPELLAVLETQSKNITNMAMALKDMNASIVTSNQPVVNWIGAHRDIPIHPPLDDFNIPPEGKIISGNDVEEPVEPLFEPTVEAPTESEQPSGDSFRFVDDLPPSVVTSTQRTPQQEVFIDALKKRGNISVLPPGPDSSVRVMQGSIEYTIYPDGRSTERETGAGTTSLV